MFINRTNQEDLTMLRLFVDKLEELMTDKGIKYFYYVVSSYELEDLWVDSEYDMPSRSPEEERPEARVGPIKRVKLQFHSKGLFSNRFQLDELTPPDDGTYTASALNIEWDYFTNIFSVFIGSDSYEKEVAKAGGNTTLRKTHSHKDTNIYISFDFKFENRREIQLIKVRLGKLYAKLVKDRKLEEERFCRKQLTDVALQAFPDLLDSLILGGSSSEKERNS